jgi:hypothetical protein
MARGNRRRLGSMPVPEADRRTIIVARIAPGVDTVEEVCAFEWPDTHLDCRCGDCAAAVADVLAKRLGGFAIEIAAAPGGWAVYIRPAEVPRVLAALTGGGTA